MGESEYFQLTSLRQQLESVKKSLLFKQSVFGQSKILKQEDIAFLQTHIDGLNGDMSKCTMLHQSNFFDFDKDIEKVDAKFDLLFLFDVRDNDPHDGFANRIGLYFKTFCDTEDISCGSLFEFDSTITRTIFGEDTRHIHKMYDSGCYDIGFYYDDK